MEAQLASVVAICATGALASTVLAQPTGDSLADTSAGQGDMPSSLPPPAFRWRQILATPRIGGRVTAMAVDPRNPKNLYVGTEEATVVFSNDGGLTWEEWELSPRVIKDRSLALKQPELPDLGERYPEQLKFFLDPPQSVFLDRLPVPLPQLVQFDTLPEYMRVFVLSINPNVPQNLLDNVVSSRRRFTHPVVRMAVCPGAHYEIVVATLRELYGSSDGGRIYRRLFSIPGKMRINTVTCNQIDPSNILLATEFGLFQSLDGGLSFNQVLVGWPGAETTACTFAHPEEGRTPVFAAWGSSLFHLDDGSPAGFSFIYPDFQNSSTAPWKDIRWVSVTKNGSVWMATDDGVRVSRDAGKNWDTEARSLFERTPIKQVLVGTNAWGGERIIVRTRNWIYASDDDGRTWQPFFNAVTRRSFAHMTEWNPPGGGETEWWVVTKGEVWTTKRAEEQEVFESRAAIEWAQDQMDRTPPVGRVIRKILDNTRLSPEGVQDLVRRTKLRNWIPGLTLQAGFEHRRFDTTERQDITAPFERFENIVQSQWGIFAQAIWYFNDLPFVTEELGGVQKKLHELRRQVGFIAEDAWHERMMLLQRIAAGEADRMQYEMLRHRIRALEALLEFWLERPLIDEGERQPTRVVDERLSRRDA